MTDTRASDVIRGDPIAPGVTGGTLCVFEARSALPRTAASGVGRGSSCSPESEFDRFRAGIDALVADLGARLRGIDADAQQAEAQITRAHLAMLRDPELHKQVHELIEEGWSAAEQAVEQVVQTMADALARVDDPLMAERAADLRDLSAQLQAKLTGGGDIGLAALVAEYPNPVVAVPELLPSLVLQAEHHGVVGFVIERGTALGHGAILAHSFGLPVVRVPTMDALRSHEGAVIELDGTVGTVALNAASRSVTSAPPLPADLPRQEKPPRLSPERAANAPTVQLWLSITDPQQLRSVSWEDVAGIGLYRTEYLFIGERHDFPTEQEQLRVYREIFEHAGDRPVTVRTADLGADKPVPYLAVGHQENPNLGLRAHRLYRFHPELLTTQLRALLQAAADHPHLRILYPMVECLEQWRFVQRLTAEAVESLRKDGLRFQDKFERGPLIETPSAALSFRRLLQEADFACIGTNDLVQYLFAVDRGASDVADLYQPEHPVVLNLLQQLVCQAKDAEKPLILCGEAAADLQRLPLFLGIGIRNLSVPIPDVGILRSRLAVLDADECCDLARQCLQADDTQQVREWLSEAGLVVHRPAPPATRDPVCGMTVDPARTPFTVDRGDTRHYFCSARCRQQYLRATSAG